MIVFGIVLPKGLMQAEPGLIYGYFDYGTCPEDDWAALKAAKEIERRYDGYVVPFPSDGPYEYWGTKKWKAVD
ncbi:MAG: hypothetical protein K6U80_17540 [Firmicutes bacterium]|nr:hypothetical protein [Bacillota bacterium]